MSETERVSRPRCLVCPVCETGELEVYGQFAGRCDSCGCIVNGPVIETLMQVIDLPEALGRHACECGHPEMRRLETGVYRCPACGDEVQPPRPCASGDCGE